MVDKAELAKHITAYDSQLEQQPQQEDTAGLSLGLASSFIPTTYLLNDPASREAFSAEMAGADGGRRGPGF